MLGIVLVDFSANLNRNVSLCFLRVYTALRLVQVFSKCRKTESEQRANGRNLHGERRERAAPAADGQTDKGFSMDRKQTDFAIASNRPLRERTSSFALHVVCMFTTAYGVVR